MPVFSADRPERRKEIPGYGGRYFVSDLGKVYSGEFELTLIGGRYVYLSSGGEVERCSVSYLVARAFLANAERRPYVRHLNGNVRDNRVENLEWCEWKERCGKAGGREDLRKGLMVYDLDGKFVGKFDSVKSAADELGVARSLITRCALGKAKRAKQWIFRYV